MSEEILPRVVAGHSHDDSADAFLHQGAHSEEAKPNRVGLGVSKIGIDQSGSADVLDERIGRRRKQDAELIGEEVVATGAVGEEAQLLFLDAILHVAALTVDVFVKRAGVAGEVGNDESGVRFAVVTAAEVFRLDDHSAWSIPTFGGVVKRAEEAMTPTVDGVGGGDLSDPLGGLAFEYGVAREAENVANIVVVAPTHESPAAESRVAANRDGDIGPDLTQTDGQQLHDGGGMARRINVGGAEVGHEQLRPTEDIERQEAIAVVVAVEEAVFLFTVDGIVGGVKVEREVFGRFLERGDELIDEDLGDSEQRRPRDAILQPAESGRGGEWQGVVTIAAGVIGGGQPERIVAEALMVVEIFVSAGDAQHTLRQERALRMEDKTRMTRIGDPRIKGIEQAKLSIGFAEQQQSRIGSDVAGGKLGLQQSPVSTGKRQARSVRLCHRGGLGPVTR